MSNQVDFAFQGDVINLGSLTHMLTGRVLKALSDGKVDIYAVGAAFWLGARVPIQSSVADTVHAHVAQRRGYQSVLSKALSIGWGHSTPVVEMTRTRAGTNALLLVGALGMGATPFQAAQCLSELLGIYGISLERLPSVDVLKELAAYLTPFVYDLGFSKVLQHITDVVEGALEAEILSHGRMPDRQPLWELRHLGSASALASAIKQLIYTSQNRQDHYMVLKMRGSWLPAFAGHLLGMSVELRCHGKLLWACGGDRGSVTFQLGAHPVDKFSIQPSNASQMLIMSPETLDEDCALALDYLIGDAMEAILAKRPQVDSDIAVAIHDAIWRLSKKLFSSFIIRPGTSWSGEVSRPYRTTGDFDSFGGLENVLGSLSIRPNQQQSAETFPRQIRPMGNGRIRATGRRVHTRPPSPSSYASSPLSSPSPSRSPSPVHQPPWKPPSSQPLETPSAKMLSSNLPQPSTVATQFEPKLPVPIESPKIPLRPRSSVHVIMGPASHGLRYMARGQVLRLASSCHLHRYDVDLVAETMIDTLSHLGPELCICQQIGIIIHNTSVIALALAHCRFDPLELRIPETSLTQGKSHGESWCTRFIPSSDKVPTDYTTESEGKTFEYLIEYLAQVFCVDYSSLWRRNTSDTTSRYYGRSCHILGLSGGTYTIHFSCIMENDCYDEFGRTISIRTGRASVAGSFRNTIEEYSEVDWDDDGEVRRETMMPNLLAGGALLQPHYRPPKTSISMYVALHETTIELKLQVKSANSLSRRWKFTECLMALLSGVFVPSCEHGLNSVYVLQKDREVAIEGFHMARFKERSSDQILVLALQGNKLEQLLICGMLIDELAREEKAHEQRIHPAGGDPYRKRGVLQISSCLECCVRFSQKDDNCLPVVIIGG